MTKADTAEWIDELSALEVGEICLDEPMSLHTSFGIGGKADVWIHPGTEEEATRAATYCQQHEISCLAVGEGTNVLVRDGGIRAAVIQICKSDPDCHIDKDFVLDTGAGVGVPWLIQHLAERGLSGLEFAAGIPGTVGGGLAGNAGTGGIGLGDRAMSVRMVREGRVEEIPASDLNFAYRCSDIDRSSVAVGARIQLSPGDPERCLNEIRDRIRQRRDTQPLWNSNAGCIFKNPSADTPAGKLIEQLGLKGTAIGNAQVSPLHANFIINAGGATAEDVLQLIEKIKEHVFKETGVCLKEEIRVVGEKP